eukprot:8947722-Pyramimonas_sp.AAC.1
MERTMLSMCTLPVVAFNVEAVWADCAGIVSAAKGRARASSACCGQAHMWTMFHAACEDGLAVH